MVLGELAISLLATKNEASGKSLSNLMGTGDIHHLWLSSSPGIEHPTRAGP